MQSSAKPQLTEAEYLAIENASESRSEFFNGEIFAMVGGSPAHNQIKENLVGELLGRFKGGKCRTRSSDQRVRVTATGLITYPDVLIVCEEPQYDSVDPHSLVNPTVLIEVLSPSTEKYDRYGKFEHYKKIPTLKECILVSQDCMVLESFVRNEQGEWLYSTFVGETSNAFQFATIPVSLKMTEIIDGVDIPQGPAKPAHLPKDGSEF